MATKVERINRFILNSDYMPIANIGAQEINVTIPAGKLYAFSRPDLWRAEGSGSKEFEFAVPAGAISRTSVTFYPKNTPQTGQTMSCEGAFIVEDMWENGLNYIVYWERASETKITVKWYVRQIDGFPPLSTYPSFTFKLRSSYFYPPNMG